MDFVQEVQTYKRKKFIQENEDRRKKREDCVKEIESDSSDYENDSGDRKFEDHSDSGGETEIRKKRRKRRMSKEDVRYRREFLRMLRETVHVIIVIAAIAVLISNLMVPVLRIYGHSMNDTLDEGDIVLSIKGSTFKTGDIIAFYYNNKLLIKRVIGDSGDWINIDEDGTVYVNDKKLEEPYLEKKALGECNIELPYQVPESRVFVMGDNRDVSIDSRNTAVGCVAEEQIVGKIVFRVWPFGQAGFVE